MSRFGSSAVKLSSVSRRGKPPVLNVCLKIFVVVVVVVVVAVVVEVVVLAALHALLKRMKGVRESIIT